MTFDFRRPDLDDFSEEWSKDAEMDLTEPHVELSKVGTLHAKWLKVLTYHKAAVAKLDIEYKKEKKFKWEYYRGDPSVEEEVKKRGLTDYYSHAKILDAKIPIYLESDTDLININLKKALHQLVVDFSESVMTEIKNRSYELQNIIKWEIFTGGPGNGAQ